MALFRVYYHEPPSKAPKTATISIKTNVYTTKEDIRNKLFRSGIDAKWAVDDIMSATERDEIHYDL